MKGKKRAIDELKEFESIIRPVETRHVEEKIVKIISDKKHGEANQYSVRIPKKFSRAVNLDNKKHKFKFILDKSKDKIVLRGELV